MKVVKTKAGDVFKIGDLVVLCRKGKAELVIQTDAKVTHERKPVDKKDLQGD
jgi:hypothetical protein